MINNNDKKLFNNVPESTIFLIVCTLIYSPGIALVAYGVHEYGFYDSLVIATFFLIAVIAYSVFNYLNIRKTEKNA